MGPWKMQDVTEAEWMAMIGEERKASANVFVSRMANGLGLAKAVALFYGNSVIEHVGDWHEQKRLAAEIRTSQPTYFVQPPNRWFPIESLGLAAFIQFVP